VNGALLSTYTDTANTFTSGYPGLGLYQNTSSWSNFVASGTSSGVSGEVSWAGDTGLSRIGAASLALGNGTAGDASGSVSLTGINNQGGCIVKRPADKITGYTTTATDYVLAFTATATLVLDSGAAVAGTTYRIKLKSAATAGSVLTIAPNNGMTIDNAATLIMVTLGQAVDVVYDGSTNWDIF
jgi:hypothetical protein